MVSFGKPAAKGAARVQIIHPATEILAIGSNETIIKHSSSIIRSAARILFKYSLGCDHEELEAY